MYASAPLQKDETLLIIPRDCLITAEGTDYSLYHEDMSSSDSATAFSETS